PDLAVANGGTGGVGVSVLLGRGDGGFGGPTNFPAGSLPRSVAVGDFNADSHPDLAVANQGSGGVSVLLARAGGGFGSPTNFPAGQGSRSVAVGDFNADSRPDLAVANLNFDVSVLLNTTTGCAGQAATSEGSAGADR